MKFTFDHDLHIHTHLSTCSGEPEQTVENILEYAKRNNLSKICVTDHYWDENVPGASFWYQPQNFLHIKKSLPLPKADGIEFLFGCETDVDKNMTLGIPEERYDEFDFIIVPTTHMHMTGFTVDESVGPDCEKRAELWIKRLDAVLNSSLPFEKVGIAHLTTTLISPSSKEATINTLNLIPDSEMRRLFAKAEKLGCGICFDVGHANVSGYKISEQLEILRGKLDVLHIHDNHGVRDEHLLPFEGNVDWQDVAEGIKKADFRGILDVEVTAWALPGDKATRDAFGGKIVARAKRLMKLADLI
jgi:histidinol phosphatase-like PHP family hydrolase